MIVVIIYVIGTVSMFFWLKKHQQFKERTWNNVYDRLLASILFPISLGFYMATYKGNEPKISNSKPPKWL